MAAKDLMFKIAIYDDTKDKLAQIQKNLSGLRDYAQNVSQSVTALTNALGRLGDNNGIGEVVKNFKELQEISSKKLNAFDVSSLKGALSALEKISSTMGGGKLTSSFKKATESMDATLEDMTKTSQGSLYSYRMRVEKALNDISKVWKDTVKEVQKNGGLDLFPNTAGRPAVLSSNVKELQTAYEKLQLAAAGFMGAMNKNLGAVGHLQLIIDKVQEVVDAVGRARTSLSDKGLFDGVKNQTDKNLNDILSKINELEARLQSFGNGSYPDVMKGFVTAVDNAVKQVSEKLKVLNEVQPNVGGTAEVHKADNEAIEAKIQLINKLKESVASLEEKYNRSLAASQKFAGQDLDRVKTMLYQPVSNAEYQLEKSLNAVFSNVFKGLDFSKIANSQPSVTTGQEVFNRLRDAMASGSQKAIAGAKEITKMSAVNDTFASGANTQEVMSFLENISSSAKKNSVDFKAAQYALEQYKLALSTAKDPKFANVEKSYNNAVAASKRYSANMSDVFKAEWLEDDRRAFEKKKAQLLKEQEELAKLQQQYGAPKTPKELTLNFKEDDFVAPLERAQQRIKDIIARIQQDVSGGLKDALNTDLSATKTVQSLNELANGLSGLETKLQGVSQTLKSAQEASNAINEIKTNLGAVKNGGTTTSGGEDKNALDVKTLVRNLNLLATALERIDAIRSKVTSQREIIAANGGDTAAIDRYIAQLNELRTKIGVLREQPNIIGQKGMMLTEGEDSLNALRDKLQSVADGGKVTLDVLRAIVQLGRSTPTGTEYKEITGKANSFKQDAKEYEDAAARIKKAQDALSVLREKVTSAEGISMENGKEIVGLDRLRSLFTEINDLQKKLGNTTDAREGVKLLGKEYDTLSQRVREAVNAQNEALRNRERVNQRLDPIEQYLATANATYSRGSSLGVDANSLSNLDSAIQKMTALQNEIIGFGKADYLDKNKMQGVLDQYVQLRNTILNAASAVSVLATKQQSLKDKQQRVDDKAAKQAAQEQADSWGKATENLARYDNKLKDAETLLKNVEDVNQRLGKNIDTTGLRDYVEYLRAISRQLHEINQNNVMGTAAFGRTNPSVPGTKGELYSEVVGPSEKNQAVAGERAQKEASQALTQALKEESDAQKKAEQAKRQSAQASEQLAKSENSVAQAIANSTNSARGQSQVLSDLKSMATQYLSVWGAQQFVSDMTNITGELELQERSLEVILGNASAAREMYSQIRDLSQMSPYTFEDLLKSHRQLAAFGIEAKDIFGTLKSLSDIGAGLDVDVSRLILAYGHTKSYGYLSGIQNRQFETAGIDLVGALSDLYNRRADSNKRLGISSDYTTRADIFKRMRARSIPFSDVQEVIMDLDKPGGKFYNMQIRQYDTLGGKLRNLRNNYRIMMSEIGEDNHGLLAGSVDMINELTANWQKYGRILKGVALGYAAMKLAALMAGKSVLAANKQIIATTVGNRSKTLATTYLNNPTSSWWRPNMSGYNVPISGTMSNGEFRNLKTSKDISNITKQRIALTGKLTEAQRAELLVETGVNRARATQIAGFSPWKRGIMTIRLGFIQAGAAVKAFTLSLLTNPMTWIFAAVGVFTSIKSKLDEASEAAKTFAGNLRDAAKTDQEGIRQSLGEYGKLATLASEYSQKRTKESREDFRAEAEARGVENVFEDLRKKLEAQSPFYAGDYFDIMKANDELDRLSDMFDKYRTIQKVKGVEERRSGDWENRLDDSAGEGFGANAKDYDDSRREFVSAMERSSINYWSRLTQSEKDQISAYANAVGESMRDAASKNRAIAGWFAQNGSEGRLLQLEGGVADSNVMTRFRRMNVGGWLMDSYSTDFRKSSKALVDGFVSDFKNDFKDDADGMSEYVTDILNKQFGDAKVSDPGSIAKMTDEFYSDLSRAMLSGGVNSKNVGELFALQAEKTIGSMVQKGLEGQIDASMSTEQVKAKVKQIVSDTIKAWKQQYPRLARVLRYFGIDIDKLLGDSANNIAKKMVPQEAWQRRAIKMKMVVEPEFDNDWSTYIDKVRKDIHDKAQASFNTIQRFKTKFHLDIGFDINSKDLVSKLTNNVNKILNPAINALWVQYGKATNAKSRESIMSQITEYRAAREAQLAILKSAKYLKSEGVPVQTEKEQDKSDRAAEAARNKRDQANRKHDNDLIKRLTDRQKAIQTVYEWYKRWYDLLGNSDAAMNEALKLVKATDIKGIDPNDLKSWDTYVKLLERERAAVGGEASNIRVKENVDRLDQIKTSYTDTINKGDSDNFSREQERAASALDKMIDRLGKEYDLYKKIYELTGNREMASQLSGRSLSNSRQSKADDVRDAIQSNLNEARARLSLSEFDLPFDRILNMDDETIKRTVGTILNIDDDGKVLEKNRDLAVSYKAIVDALTKWRDLQEQINNEAKESYATLISSVATYANTISKANGEYDEQIRKLRIARENGSINQTEYNQAAGVAGARRDRTIMEASPNYKNLMAGVSFIPGLLQQGGEEAIKRLTEQLAKGEITADEYSQKVEAINSAMEKLDVNDSTSMFSTFINSGFQGVLERRLQNSKDVRKIAAQSAESAASELNSAEAEYSRNPTEQNRLRVISARANSDKAKQDVEEANRKVQENEESSESYKKFSKAMEDTIKALGYLNNAVSLLSNVFDSLGLGDTAVGQAASDAGDLLGGALSGASSLSFLGPWGMAAGAGLGLIGGLAGLHDKHAQQRIEKLQEDVSKIEGYTETIAKAQERTLGYDYGSVLRGYQQQYRQGQMTLKVLGQTINFGSDGAAGGAMEKYYEAAGEGSITGYQQQYNLLIQKRKDYIGMYNAEDSKKKKSASALEEYKQKLAELDDQIKYFSEDLAKTLYEIDLKSWADQIGDALMTAFENGEDAAEAFRDTVTTILQGLTKKMLVTGMIEPMLQGLQKELFGYDERGNYIGVFNPNDPAKSTDKVLAVISKYLGEDGVIAKRIPAIEDILNATEELVNNNGNNTLLNNDSATMSSSIKGITEQTADLLAAYLNAIRADVSVIRQVQSLFYQDSWPDYVRMMTSGTNSLASIDTNVTAIRSLLSENGVLFEQVRTLRDDLHHLITHQEYINVK